VSWLQPWINGQTDRPPIDWAASTPEEAWLMVQVAHAIGRSRKGSYNHLKLQANDRLMPLSADLPEIVIVVDEGKNVLSGTATGIIGDIRDKLIQISDELRDAGVRVVASGLRGTADYIATAFKVQSRVKIGMPVDSDAELAYLFDWDKGLKCADLPTMGCGYVQYEQKPPRMFKTRHILPGHITESAIAVAGIRPDLDQAGADAGDGHHYATRYERMREVFSHARPSDNAAGGELVPAPAITTARTAAAPVVPAQGRPHLSVVGGGRRPADWPDPRDIAHGTAPAPMPLRPADWPDPAQLAGRPATGVLTAPTATTAAAPVRPLPELLTRALAAFAAANDDKMHGQTLAGALGITYDKLASCSPPSASPHPRKGSNAAGRSAAATSWPTSKARPTASPAASSTYHPRSPHGRPPDPIPSTLLPPPDLRGRQFHVRDRGPPRCKRAFSTPAGARLDPHSSGVRVTVRPPTPAHQPAHPQNPIRPAGTPPAVRACGSPPHPPEAAPKGLRGGRPHTPHTRTAGRPHGASRLGWTMSRGSGQSAGRGPAGGTRRRRRLLPLLQGLGARGTGEREVTVSWVWLVGLA